MRFEEAHDVFIESHMKQRRGARLYNLKKLHDHAEKLMLEAVWWVAFGNFDNLHPQYEVYDFKDGKRYLDFAFIQSFIKICIEIDGFGPHWQNISLEDFSDDRMRQNHLIIDGWYVIRFAYDHLVNQPRQCQQILQQLIGRLLGNHSHTELSHYEHEVIRYGVKIAGFISARDVQEHLQITIKAARSLLRTMAVKDFLIPIGGPQRVHRYQVNIQKINSFRI